MTYLFFLKIVFVYFKTEREGRRKRGRETSLCGCLSHAPYWGPGPQPRHVPSLGIKLATFWFIALNPLSYTSQGCFYDFNKIVKFILLERKWNEELIIMMYELLSCVLRAESPFSP